MLSLTQRHHVGHDILLARHGRAIASMSLDKDNNRVVAVLNDGSRDSAPNLISQQPSAPATITGSRVMDRQLMAYAIIGFFAVMAIVFIASMSYLSTLDTDQLAFFVNSTTNYPTN